MTAPFNDGLRAFQEVARRFDSGRVARSVLRREHEQQIDRALIRKMELIRESAPATRADPA
jgi:hypothetical protein